MAISRKAALAAAVLAMVPVAGAMGVEYSGSGGVLTDGATPSATSFTMDISGTGATIGSIDSITLSDLNHPSLGDLYIYVTAPDSSTYLLMAPPDNANTNFNGTYSWVATGDAPTIDEALIGLGDTDLPQGTYHASDYGGSLVVGESLGERVDWSHAAGIGLDGTWTLTVNDWIPGNSGSLGSWSIDVTVPEPATAGMMALGGLTLLRRRR